MLLIHEAWVTFQHANVLFNPFCQQLDRRYGVAMLRRGQHWVIASVLVMYWSREVASMLHGLGEKVSSDIFPCYFSPIGKAPPKRGRCVSMFFARFRKFSNSKASMFALHLPLCAGGCLHLRGISYGQNAQHLQGCAKAPQLCISGADQIPFRSRPRRLCDFAIFYLTIGPGPMPNFHT